MTDNTEAVHLDEAHVIGPGGVPPALVDELFRSGRKRHDPLSSPQLLKLEEESRQTMTPLDLTDEQVQALRDSVINEDREALMRMLRGGESQ